MAHNGPGMYDDLASGKISRSGPLAKIWATPTERRGAVHTLLSEVFARYL